MQMAADKGEGPSSAAVASRRNEEELRAELSGQRELVSRLHSEISSSAPLPSPFPCAPLPSSY